jgi:hypothetical protein
MKKLLLATLALAAMTTAAWTQTVNLRLTQDGTLTQDFLGAPGQTTFTAGPVQFGDFLISNITGSTVGSTIAPVLVSGSTLDIQNTATGPHTLDVWITGNGLTSPNGLTEVFSGFANSVLSAGWATNLQSLFSATDQMFTGTVIDSALFAGTPFPSGQSATRSSLVDLGAGPYSLTAHFLIQTDGPGQSNSTITIAAVPGPIVGAGLPGLLGMLGFGGFQFWKRRKQTA